MPGLAERATLDPERHGNVTGGHWPQLGQKQARKVLVMLSASLGPATSQNWDSHLSPVSGVWGQLSATELLSIAIEVSPTALGASKHCMQVGVTWGTKNTLTPCWHG